MSLTRSNQVWRMAGALRNQCFHARVFRNPVVREFAVQVRMSIVERA